MARCVRESVLVSGEVRTISIRTLLTEIGARAREETRQGTPLTCRQPDKVGVWLDNNDTLYCLETAITSSS